MKTLDAGQSTLLGSRSVALVNLVKLVTYSDRDPETVSTTFYFSDHWILYDYGNTGTDQQFEPLMLRVELERQTMTHLPDPRAFGESALRKNLRLTLRNGARETGNRLYKDLRAENLEFAAIEWSQLLIDRPAGDGFTDLRSYVGDEHTVRFRGDLELVERATDEEVEIRFRTRLPQIPWLVASDPTKNDPRDVGARLPMPYGIMPKVPAIGWEVGAVTTLAEEIDDVQTSIQLTDVTGIATSGNARIGEEEISWTGITANQLTTVTRGTQSTVAVAHAASEVVTELLTTVRFIVSGQGIKQIDDVYIRSPFNGELVRITTAFTKTAANTTLISGETVATIEFTTAQIRTLLDELQKQSAFDANAASSPFEQNPHQELGTPTLTNDQLDHNVEVADTSVIGSADFIAPPGTITRQDLIVYGLPSFTIRRGNTVGTILLTIASGSIGEYTLRDSGETGNQFSVTGSNTKSYLRRKLETTVPIAVVEQFPPDGPAVWRDDNLTSGQNGQATINFDDPSVTVLWQRIFVYADGGFTVRELGTTGTIIGSIDNARHSGTPSWSEFETSFTGDQVSVTGITAGKNVYEVKREVYYQSTAGLTLTDAVLVGLGLELFADVQGPTAPDTTYSVASGTLVENGPDILRHVIAELAGEGAGAIDDPGTWPTSETNISGNDHALLLNSLGRDFEEIVGRLAFEFRSNLTTEERAAGRVYRMLQATSAYVWPASARTITEWQGFVEQGRRADGLRTRHRYLYAIDFSRGLADDAFDQVVRIDPDQNDVSDPTTVELQNAEKAYGRRDAEAQQLLAVQALASAEEVAGYYASEVIRVAAIAEIRGVPWTEGYDLERGDIVSATPPWETAATKYRVLEYQKNPIDEFVDLIAVEVP